MRLKSALGCAIVLAIAIALLACVTDQMREEIETKRESLHESHPEIQATDFRIVNLLVEIGPLDKRRATAGDLRFSEDHYTFRGFGDLGNPNFEFLVHKDATVVSPCNGVVTRLIYQEDTDDYEIFIRPTMWSPWRASIDHVVDLTIQLGDQVVGGQEIGRPQPLPRGLGRVELQINNDDLRYYYAPFALFEETLRSQFESQIWQLMSDIETFTRDFGRYSEWRMIFGGCYDIVIPETGPV